MADFAASLWVPNYSQDVVRGSARAGIFIEVEDDYSAAVSGAEWDLLSLFTSIAFDTAGAGGGESILDVRLVNGTIISLDDTAVASNVLQRSIKMATVRDAVELDEFIDTIQGKKYFVCINRGNKGTTKRVFFGYGYFDLSTTNAHSYDAAIQHEITFKVKAHKLESASITLPPLPTNLDAAFTTDEMEMLYIGWLLAAVDSAKGGFGNAVALPSYSELDADKVGVTQDI